MCILRILAKINETDKTGFKTVKTGFEPVCPTFLEINFFWKNKNFMEFLFKQLGKKH